jgi:hypothetical protein
MGWYSVPLSYDNTMLIERCSADVAGLEPEALDVLFGISDASTYHKEYLRRTPLGAYNLSLHNVYAAFNKALDEVQRVLSTEPFRKEEDAGSWHVPLMESYERLLYTYMEHMEDCEKILGCFYRPDDPKRKKALRRFNDTIRECRDHVAPIVNGIKHEQLRLECIVYFNDAAAVIGYFVAGPDSDGVIGPASKVHANGDEAYSFAVDLKYLFAWVFILSRHLKDAIGQVAPPCVPPSPSMRDNHGDAIVTGLAARISALPNRVFPHEIGFEIPSIRLTESDRGSDLKIETPTRPRDVFAVFNGRLLCMNLGDGTSTDFRFPRFGRAEQVRE